MTGLRSPGPSSSLGLRRTGCQVRGELVGVLLDVAAALLGELQQPAALALAALDQALVLELLDGRVDRAGARLPGAAAALGDLLDDLVAVHRLDGEHVEDRGADVTAAHLRAPRRRATRTRRARRDCARLIRPCTHGGGPPLHDAAAAAPRREPPHGWSHGLLCPMSVLPPSQ